MPLCHVQMNAEADKLAKTADEKIGHGAGEMSLFIRSDPIWCRDPLQHCSSFSLHAWQLFKLADILR